MGIKIHMFPARNGDCILVETPFRNILIDGGYADTYHNSLKPYLLSRLDSYVLDLVIVTHIDQDHIVGIIALLENEDFIRCSGIKFIVFNRFNRALVSYGQGNKLDWLIRQRDILLIESYYKHYGTVNDTLASQNIPIHFFSKSKRKLLHHEIHSNSKIFITFLLPNEAQLERLMSEWKKYNQCKPSRTSEITNKSSIVCLIEFADDEKATAILLTGDGYINDIDKELKNLRMENMKLDCIKLPHHASYKCNKGIGDFIKEHNCNNVFYQNNSIVKDVEETEQEVQSHNAKIHTKGIFDI